uniref:Nucleoside phosphorylase domain-containing protein n=1 Tax=Arcella intermedia TaxID=1963864 RepID=A0A6B2LH43_9EUKA
MSSFLEGVVCIGQNREYITYNGTYKGVPVTIASHGVGGGGASMAFEELITAGGKIFIRAGTCGSLDPDYREGSFMIVNGAVRRDGVTDNLVNREYPAVAHHRIVASLEDTAREHNVKYKVGFTVSEGCFYSGPLGDMNAFWQKANVASIEMEVSVLFVIASIRKVHAGAILNVDNYIFERLESTEGYKPHKEVVIQGNKKMGEIALDAIIKVDVAKL